MLSAGYLSYVKGACSRILPHDGMSSADSCIESDALHSFVCIVLPPVCTSTYLNSCFFEMSPTLSIGKCMQPHPLRRQDKFGHSCVYTDAFTLMFTQPFTQSADTPTVRAAEQCTCPHKKSWQGKYTQTLPYGRQIPSPGDWLVSRNPVCLVHKNCSP